MKKAFVIDGKVVYIEVEETTNKNMYLKIKNAEIVLSKPKHYPWKLANEFIQNHYEKMIDTAEKIRKNFLYSLDENLLYFNGKKYNLNILSGAYKPHINTVNKNMYINTKLGTTSEADRLVKSLLRENLKKYLNKHVPLFEKKMNLSGHKIRVIFKTSTWGTNNIATKSLSFSSKLSHFRDEVKNYLIVHELAHTHFPNHSNEFWSEVEKWVPNWKELRNELRAETKVSES